MQQTVAKIDDEDIQHLNNSEKPYTCPLRGAESNRGARNCHSGFSHKEQFVLSQLIQRDGF